MYLISYNPFEPSAKESPYLSSGPIFVHTTACKEYSDSEIPMQQSIRMLSVRAFDKEHIMLDADLLQGAGLAEKAKQMLRDERVEYLHVHYALRGCFAVQIERQ